MSSVNPPSRFPSECFITPDLQTLEFLSSATETRLVVLIEIGLPQKVVHQTGNDAGYNNTSFLVK